MPRTHRKPRQQPHTFPEQSSPTYKRYRVTGPQRVGEVAKGGVVELALTEGQEKALIDAGHIEHAPPVYREVPAAPPEPPSETPRDDSAPLFERGVFARGATSSKRPGKADDSKEN